MAIFQADWFHSFLVVVILFTYYRPPIYRPMHVTDLFIVNDADLEYTKKLFF